MEKTFWTAAGLLYLSAIVLLLIRLASGDEGVFPWGFWIPLGLGTLAAALGNAVHAAGESESLATPGDDQAAAA